MESPASLELHFFDLLLRISSDNERFVWLLGQMFSRFRLKPLSPMKRLTAVELTYLTLPESRQPCLIADGEVSSNVSVEYAYANIFSAIVTRVCSHLLIHAGVVACCGQGVILVADSMHGKTTLVLELVQRGFSFLSDDIAALGRADKLVHPFPRSLAIRSGTLELTGFSEPIGATKWLGKWLLDIEELQPDSLGEASPIRHIIILHNPTPPRVGAPAGHDKWASRRAGELPKGERTRPSFDGPARLETIPQSHALMALLPRFLAGYQSFLQREEFNGHPTHLFMELARIIREATCYQLSLGPLQEMADLVCEVMPTHAK